MNAAPPYTDNQFAVLNNMGITIEQKPPAGKEGDSTAEKKSPTTICIFRGNDGTRHQVYVTFASRDVTVRDESGRTVTIPLSSPIAGSPLSPRAQIAQLFAEQQ